MEVWSTGVTDISKHMGAARYPDVTVRATIGQSIISGTIKPAFRRAVGLHVGFVWLSTGQVMI